MKTYTIGEIFRLKLLKNHLGEPYKHKATLSKIVNKIGAKTIKTAFGEGKVLTEKQINDYNAASILNG